MQAVVAHAFGAPDTFTIEEVPTPLPATGEVTVRIARAAVNFVDLIVSSGRYQVRPPLPFIPGGEFAGVVEAVGDGVSGFKPGDRVCGSKVGGAFAEFVAIDATLVYQLPATLSTADAATFRVNHATAYHALVQRARLAPGETVLVLGAAGAVGTAAIQIAKALGTIVVASASSTEKQALAMAAGADHAITSGAEDWRAQLKAVAPGGADVVVDPVGGAATEPAFRSLTRGGRHLVIGFAAGSIPSLPTNLALVKSVSLVGVDVRQFSLLEPAASAANMQALFAMHAEGKLRPAAVEVYALPDFAAAMERVQSGAGTARVALDMGGPHQ